MIKTVSCGIGVTNMTWAYTECINLTGSPVCGPNVVEMLCTYFNCRNLTGSPVCGDKVKSMDRSYYNCINLTGSPVCGPNVTNMYATYYNCRNLYGNMYVYSDNVSDVQNCFYNRNNSKRLNIFVKANTKSYNTFIINNTKSIAGKNFIWVSMSKYKYNTSINVYLYAVNNVYQTKIDNGD